MTHWRKPWNPWSKPLSNQPQTIENHNAMKHTDIPVMFYLRQNQGTDVYTYWNHKKTINGIVTARTRRAAKCKIIRLIDGAQFYR